MKRILICASRISHILNFHLPYIEYFRSNGYDVDVAAQGTTDHPLISRCYDVSFTKNPFSPDNIRTMLLLKKLLKNGGYSMVYSNSTLAGAALKAADIMAGRPVPYFVHISHGYMFDGGKGLKSKLYLLAEKSTRSAVDSLVVMNLEDYELAEKNRLGRKIHYINGMGVVTENFPMISAQERKSVRDRLSASDETRILLCVGEFSERKNQSDIIHAFNMIYPEHRDALLVFAGEGKTLEQCSLLAEQEELSGCTRFLGQVKDMNSLYRSCDILVSASKMEGLPFNVMEAMFCGMAVVASDIKGHRELLSDGQCGMLYNGGPEGLAECLDRLLSDEAMYRSFRENASLDEKFYIDHVKDDVLEILCGSSPEMEEIHQ